MARLVQHGLVCLAVVFMACGVLTDSVQAQGKTPITAPSDSAARPAANSQPTLESLLAASGFAYRQLDDGSYRITVELDGMVTVVTADEVTMNWQDAQGNDVKIVYLYSWVADLPQEGTRSLDLLTTINAMNNARYIGRVVVNDYGLYVCNSFFLQGSSAESLVQEVYLASNDSLIVLEKLGTIIRQLQQ